MPARTPIPSYGRVLAAIRKYRGFTQVQLAEQVGIFQVSLARLETGVRYPSLELAERIAAALQVPLPVFLPFRQPSKDWRKALASVPILEMNLPTQPTLTSPAPTDA